MMKKLNENFPDDPVVKIHLPKQGTQIQSLIQEDSTHSGQIIHVPQLLSMHSRDHALQQEGTAVRSPSTTAREWPPFDATREIPCTAVMIQCSPK